MRETLYDMYLAAFNSAEKSIHLTNSYFVPDERTQKALIDAAARGVDVKISPRSATFRKSSVPHATIIQSS